MSMLPPAGRSVAPPQGTTGGGPCWVFIHLMKSWEVLPGASRERITSCRCDPALRTAIRCHPRLGGRDQVNAYSPKVTVRSADGQGTAGGAGPVTVSSFIMPLAKCST